MGEDQVTMVRIGNLIELKRRADRPRDREDIERLLALADARQRLDWLWQAKRFAARALRAAEDRRADRARSGGER